MTEVRLLREAEEELRAAAQYYDPSSLAWGVPCSDRLPFRASESQIIHWRLESNEVTCVYARSARSPTASIIECARRKPGYVHR